MKFKPVSPSKLKTYSIKKRKSKVNIRAFAKPSKKGKAFKVFLD